ncbi:MAG TPA: sulfurtransferase-like selenium metabolism protein YedF [Dissulfurispiraceae bacterium]|nr:sulfurtransferase-like selenium metabolism protein YedF [Dissulfurispiraceae bacterium]
MNAATLIDARGIGCPKPVIMAEEALIKMQEGTIEVLVDNEASVSNLKRFASKNGFHSESQIKDKYWLVKIVKGYICDIPAAAEVLPEDSGKDILLIIATDTMGKDEMLGRILMKGYFETLKVTKELPHTIFFLNTGIRLTTTDEEFVAIIKEIESLGVEIFTCGTCLKYFNLESSLKTGYRGTTSHIVEGMRDFKKTVWIG